MSPRAARRRSAGCTRTTSTRSSASRCAGSTAPRTPPTSPPTRSSSPGAGSRTCRPGDEARPWLYGVARRVLANHRRGDRRRTALGDRLRRELATSVPDTQRRRRAARRRDRGDAPAQRPRPGGARAAPVGGPRVARDRRGPRAHHRGRAAPALPGPGPAPGAARQRSRATRTSPLQTTPAHPEGAADEPRS